MLEIEMIDSEAKVVADQFIIFADSMRNHIKSALDRSSTQSGFQSHQAIVASQVESLYGSHVASMGHVLRMAVMNSQSSLDLVDSDDSDMIESTIATLQSRVSALMLLQKIDTLDKLNKLAVTMRFNNRLSNSAAVDIAGLGGPITTSSKNGATLSAHMSITLIARHSMLTLHNDLAVYQAQMNGAADVVIYNANPDHRHHLKSLSIEQYAKQKAELFHHRSQSLVFQN